MKHSYNWTEDINELSGTSIHVLRYNVDFDATVFDENLFESMIGIDAKFEKIQSTIFKAFIIVKTDSEKITMMIKIFNKDCYRSHNMRDLKEAKEFAELVLRNLQNKIK